MNDNVEILTPLEERQALLAHHVRLVARSKSFGLCVLGKTGGLGKSKIVMDTLAEEGLRPVVLNSHCTALSLYRTLFNNPDRIIFLDDCEGMFSYPVLGLLRSALWGDERIVTYNSSQLDLENSFEFKGRIIFCLNSIPKNSAFKAVLSRIDCFSLDATNSEVIDLMRKLARDGFEDLPAETCLEVVDYIAEFASSRQLSLRLLEPAFRKVIYAQESDNDVDWRELIQSQLSELGVESSKPVDSKAFDRSCLQEALKQHPTSAKDQETFWCKATGKSRASFYRAKKTYEARRKRRQNPKSS